MPTSLVLLAVIALVLHILFTYLIPNPSNPQQGPWFRTILSIIVIVVILLLWYVLPVRVG